MSTKPAQLTHRPARSIPASILAVLAILFGGLGTWLLGGFVFDGSWPGQATETVDRLSQLSLLSATMIAAAAVVAVIGIVFVLGAVLPGDAGRRAVLGDDTPGQTAMARRDLARRVERRVELVDGVQDVRAHIRGRSVRIQVRTPVDEVAAVRDQAHAAVHEAITALAPVRPLRPHVQISRTR